MTGVIDISTPTAIRAAGMPEVGVAPQPLLEVRDLSLSFATAKGALPITRNVNFSIAPGERVGLVGESGCGKTVTGLSLLRLLPPQSARIQGDILFNGTNLATLSRRRMRAVRGREIAMIFQEPMSALDPVFTVGDQISEAYRIHFPVSRAEGRERAIMALREVGIPAPERRCDEYPHQLSGGMRQRVMIAMALICKPKLLVADEPTTALDVTIQGQILAEVQKLATNLGTSLVWITHDLSVVAGLADEIAVMYAGRVVEQGEVNTVLDGPYHPYTHGLIGSVPSRNKRGEPLRQIPGMTPSLLSLPAGCAFKTRCTRADAACETMPDLAELSPGHLARCVHPHQGAEA